MNADGVDIFDKADSNLVVFCVTNNLKLKLFPAAYALLNENLSDE